MKPDFSNPAFFGVFLGINFFIATPPWGGKRQSCPAHQLC